MAKVLLKKSSVSSNAPGTGDLDYGELALNYADGRLYYKNSSNQIKNFIDSDAVAAIIAAGATGLTEVVQDTTPQLGGALDTNGNNITFGDNDKAVFGAGSDLQIYHDGSNSTIKDAGTGVLEIQTNGTEVQITGNAGTDYMARFVSNADVKLYYDHSLKFATTTTGVDVTGNIAASGSITAGDVTFNNITNNGWLDFKHDSNADNVAYSEGRLFYHNEYKTLTMHNDISDVALQIGLENWIRVYNNTGSTITNGTPVYITGASGETPTVAPADATTEAKAYVIGVATHDIANASSGVITHFGLVSGLNTSALTQGSAVHVAPDGSLQNAAPTYPYYPTEVGTCIVSDSSAGYILVDVRHHTFERFRVTGNQFIGGNLTVDGDLTVNGTQSIVTQANLAVDTSFIYTNSGDTIGSTNTNFTGSGLNDATLIGHYKGTASNKTFYVRIDGVGTGTGGVDTFEWALDSDFASPIATGVDLSTDGVALADGISVDFNATTGHTSGDRWYGTASPVNVDAGFASNRNTGTTGVGYTHMGAFFDVTDEKWKFFKSYDPEPEGTIDTTDSSYEKATIDANLTGNVTGNLTGNVTGTATNATNFNSLASTQFLRSDAADTKTSGDLSFSDNVKAAFGDSSDLQIYHDGSNSYIQDAGTGSLVIRGSDMFLRTPTDNNFLVAAGGASVTLYYNNAAKFATATDGVSITGNIAVSGTVDGRDIATDGTKLDGIEAGATGDQTASEILTAIKTVDGASSGLDADLLDGQHGSYYRINVYDASGTLLN